MSSPTPASRPTSTPVRQRPQDPVEIVAAAVEDCPLVLRLSSGLAGAATSYLPGKRVEGVRLTDDEVEVRVVAAYGPPVTEVADQVRAAVRPHVGSRPIAVGIDDVEFLVEAPLDAHGATGPERTSQPPVPSAP